VEIEDGVAPERRGDCAAERGADGDGRGRRRSRERVRREQRVRVLHQIRYRGALGRVEEGRDGEERRAYRVDDRERREARREQEAERENGACDVGRYHHAASVHAVNDDAREGAEEEEREVSRYRVERDRAPDATRVRELYDEREDGDVVQPVADLGDDLPRPEPPEVRVRREPFSIGPCPAPAFFLR